MMWVPECKLREPGLKASLAKGWTSSGLRAFTLVFDLGSKLLSTSGGKEEAVFYAQKNCDSAHPNVPKALPTFLLRCHFC